MIILITQDFRNPLYHEVYSHVNNQVILDSDLKLKQRIILLCPMDTPSVVLLKSSYTAPLLLYVPEAVIQPNLWLMVNPCLACPIKYPDRDKKPSHPKLTIDRSVSGPAPAVPGQSLHLLPLSSETCLHESLHEASLSSEYQVRL